MNQFYKENVPNIFSIKILFMVNEDNLRYLNIILCKSVNARL